jgi:hypothetical protein
MAPILDRHILAAFEDALRGGQMDVDSMPAGRTEEEVMRALGEQGITPACEAIAWWTWRDGSSRRILPGLEHLPLGGACDLYETLRRQAREAARDAVDIGLGDPDSWWARSWLPIFGTGGQPKCALDCGGRPNEPSPLLWVDWPSMTAHGPPYLVAGSLGDYVARATAAINAGRYTYEPERDTWGPPGWANVLPGERF